MSECLDITVARHGPVALITLNRPARLNAYTPDMGDALVAAFRDSAADDDVGAIVVTGAGRAFCAGADRDLLTGARARNGLRIGEEFFIRGFAPELHAFAKPTLVAINGPAVGIGATMTLPFDIRLAAESAVLDFPFPRLGLMPGMGSSALLPRLVGEGRARQMMLAGGPVDARAAHACGLVAEVLPDAALLARALDLATRMAGFDRAAYHACKTALAAGAGRSVEQALAAELQASARLRRASLTDPGQTPSQPFSPAGQP